MSRGPPALNISGANGINGASRMSKLVTFRIFLEEVKVLVLGWLCWSSPGLLLISRLIPVKRSQVIPSLILSHS